MHHLWKSAALEGAALAAEAPSVVVAVAVAPFELATLAVVPAALGSPPLLLLLP